jgi:FMN-dependent NADH-azoreductase
MKNILQINTSLFLGDGQSSRLASRFVAGLQRAEPGSVLKLRDLASDPLPHLSAERFAAFGTPVAERSERQRELVAPSDALIGELRWADVIALAAPMYNFGVSSTLKAYLDHIARAGETFRYTETGPVGLLEGKQVFIFSTRGGRYAGTPADLQTGYLRTVLGFIGLTDLEFVYAEGIALGEEHRARALEEAQARVDRLAA